MKVAVFGRGKTGQEVSKALLPAQLVGPFGRQLPSAFELQGCSGAVVFVPAEGVEKIIPLLLESHLPAVIGTTGLKIPNDLEDTLKAQNLPWVWSSNFSLGIQLFKKILQTFVPLQYSLPESHFELTDIHHTKKLDAPSGTAKLIQSWMGTAGENLKIESIREGDEVGTHCLSLKNNQEEIFIGHKAFNRGVFAQGALWALENLLDIKNASPERGGLIPFEELIDRKLKRSFHENI